MSDQRPNPTVDQRIIENALKSEGIFSTTLTNHVMQEDMKSVGLKTLRKIREGIANSYGWYILDVDIQMHIRMRSVARAVNDEIAKRIG